eukprot:TRINITY_DN51490_c0_g2_i3.p1 TRINITY_DN51490_c0_g2~~TRINITY_DN51490_c0_g2_i3.p1  ORF type:complete len:238 (-),score=21.16 TRINITY_DN51490_c0_g2_i3:234-905(-)
MLALISSHFSHLQKLQICFSRLYVTQVLVPPMGESIEEGTIATILKKHGDQVQEDETLLQIDTDKVTIDVRAPTRGTVEHILVSEEDTVKVGQLVAMLGDPVPTGLEVPIDQPQPRTAQLVQQVSTIGGYKPSIQFPPRMTPDGVRISSLPADQATAYLKSWEQNLAGSSTTPSATLPQSQTVTQQSIQPKKQRTVIQEDVHPARRTLTDREMEMIELGGAMP